MARARTSTGKPRAAAQAVRGAATAGYSGTPLPKKLGIKPGSRVVLLGAPPGFEETLGTLPDGAILRRDARSRAVVVVLFASSRRDLSRRFPAAARALDDHGALWIAWPKKASGVQTDLGENQVREFGLAAGLVDYKVAAIDFTWSVHCFARRRTGR